MNSEIFNSFSLIGNIAKINEIRSQKNGTKFRYFTIAQNKKSKNEDGTLINYEPSFINIKIFEKNFKDFEPNLVVGKYIHIMGKIVIFNDENNRKQILLVGNACRDLTKTKKEKEFFEYDWLNEKDYEGGM